MIEVQDRNRVSMSQRERDVLKVMQSVLDGKRTQAEAARLLKRSVRQVRRIRQKLQAGGDAALVHGLRGKPSNTTPSFVSVSSTPTGRGTPISVPPWPARSSPPRGFVSASRRSAAGSWPRGCGSDVGTATPTAAGVPAAVASASWCRWTPRFTIGSRVAARRWF